MNMIQMTISMNCFPNLNFFEIECRSDLDLCDGYQWELLIKNHLPYLKIFHFKFQLKSTIILNKLQSEDILRSYSTGFWLNEKRWFIVIDLDQKIFYSVPRYLPRSTQSDIDCSYLSTSNDNSIFSNNINALTIWENPSNYYPNVKELCLFDHPSKNNLELIIDVKKVQRLIFMRSSIDLSIDYFIDLISAMKHLHFIRLKSIPLSFIETDRKIAFEQIHSIEFLKECQSYLVIEKLSQLFPNIQRLNTVIKSNEDIEYFLKAFSNCLSIVTFDLGNSNVTITKESIENILGHSNFTFHIDQLFIRLWIGSFTV